MLCERCHKNRASVRYAEVVDGKVKDLNLCPDCLQKHQEAAVAGFELAKPEPVVFSRSAIADAERPRPKPQERCKVCGQGLSAVIDTGRAGCSTCYETFSEPIEALLKELHGGAVHRGKTRRVEDARARVRADLQTKRTLLRSALRMENYEEAAHLRDEIHVLENELSAAERES
ncbi:MAG: protein arginine kinase activator [Candidatus Hydrogenedentes bacterium]|nr:protein arginine kinase activator [Candidatus Hydrogenedentota bacterium]